MAFQVKEVNPVEEKSVQEVEANLLNKHNEEQQVDSQEQEIPKEDIVEPVAELKAPELKDEDVLSYIKNKYNKDIGSVDELFSQKEPDLLKELNRETNLKILNPRMLSGAYQGRILSMISKLLQPKNVLEIGTTEPFLKNIKFR